MLNVREFHYPTSVKEALKLLNRYAGSGMVIAGGTTLTTWKDPKVTALVDITRLGLSYIRREGTGLSIGATTSMRDLTENVGVVKHGGGLLARAAQTVKSHLLRNAMTLGGHIVPTTPWTEASPALLALDARVRIAGSTGKETTVPYADFASQSQYRRLGRRELVTSIELDGAFAKAGTSLQAFRRTSSEPAWCQVAVALTKGKGGIGLARVVVGGVTTRATRFAKAEKLLAGASHDVTAGTPRTPGGLFATAADAVLEELKVEDDFRASVEYRKELTGVLVRRALDEAWRGLSHS
jgi:carbon-monoxide dehydrogenase medium subunit